MKVERRCAAALAAMFTAALAAAGGLHGGAPPDTVAPLSAFKGSWYELAGYGSSWQRRCTRDVTLGVTARSDVEASLTGRCRTASGVAVRTGRLQASAGDGQWRASFAPPIFNWLPGVWGDFWVLGHDELLTWVVVGGRDHQRLAVLSRTVALDEASLARALALARRAGFDVERLVRVAHDPDEWRSAGQR